MDNSEQDTGVLYRARRQEEEDQRLLDSMAVLDGINVPVADDAEIPEVRTPSSQGGAGTFAEDYQRSLAEVEAFPLPGEADANVDPQLAIQKRLNQTAEDKARAQEWFSFTDTVEQIPAGAIDGVGNMLAAPGRLTEALVEGVSGQDVDLSAGPTPTIKGLGALTKAGDAISGWVRDAMPVDSVSGGLVHGISQFVTGVKGLNALSGAGKGSALGEGALKFFKDGTSGYKTVDFLVRAASAGTGTALVAFDPHEERLANLVRDVSGADNAVLDFLAADPGDSLAESYLANALENAGIGVALEGVLKGARWVRTKHQLPAKVAEATGEAIMPPATANDVVSGLVDAQLQWQGLADTEKFTNDFVDSALRKTATANEKFDKIVNESAILEAQLAVGDVDPFSPLRTLSGEAQRAADEERLLTEWLDKLPPSGIPAAPEWGTPSPRMGRIADRLASSKTADEMVIAAREEVGDIQSEKALLDELRERLVVRGVKDASIDDVIQQAALSPTEEARWYFTALREKQGPSVERLSAQAQDLVRQAVTDAASNKTKVDAAFEARYPRTALRETSLSDFRSQLFREANPKAGKALDSLDTRRTITPAQVRRGSLLTLLDAVKATGENGALPALSRQMAAQLENARAAFVALQTTEAWQGLPAYARELYLRHVDETFTTPAQHKIDAARAVILSREAAEAEVRRADSLFQSRKARLDELRAESAELLQQFEPEWVLGDDGRMIPQLRLREAGPLGNLRFAAGRELEARRQQVISGLKQTAKNMGVEIGGVDPWIKEMTEKYGGKVPTPQKPPKGGASVSPAVLPQTPLETAVHAAVRAGEPIPAGASAASLITFGRRDAATDALLSSNLTDVHVQRLLEVYSKGGSDGAAEWLAETMNWSRMGSPEEAVSFIKNLMEVFRPQIENVTGGVRSFADSEVLVSNYLGMEPLALRERMADLFGKTKDAGELLGAFEIMAKSQAKQAQIYAEKIAGAGANPTTDDMARFVQLTRTMRDMVQLVKGTQTNIARALSARRLASRGSFIENFDAKALDEFLASSGGVSNVKRLAKKIAGAADAEQAFGHATKVKRSDVVYEMYINNMLASLKTLIGSNVLSNTGVMLWNPIERGVVHFANVVGDQGIAVASREALEESWYRFSALGEALVTGVRLASNWGRLPVDDLGVSQRASNVWMNTKDAFVNGQGGNRGIAGDIFRASPSRAITGESFRKIGFDSLANLVEFYGKVQRLPSRILIGEDAMFYNLSYMMEMTTQARRAAKAAGVPSGDLRRWMDNYLANVPKEQLAEFHKKAHALGLENTFQKALDGPVGKAGVYVQQNMPLGKFMLPFVRTPINIYKWWWTRTPLGLLARENLSALRSGTGPERAEVVGRMATGVALMTATYSAMLAGDLIGGGPNPMTQPAKREAWLADGKVPYSLRFRQEDGSYKYVAFGRLEPIGSFIGIGADIMSSFGEMDADTFEEVAWAYLTATAKMLTNKTYLQGLNQFIEAAVDPTSKGATLIANIAQNFVPLGGLVKDISEATNAPVHEWRVKDHEGDLQITQSVLNKIKGRVPWLDSEVVPKRNVFGDEVDPLPGMSMRFMAPIYGHTGPQPKVATLIADLGIPISMRRFETIDGITLSPEQRDRLILLTAKKGDLFKTDLKDDWEKLVTRKGFDDLPAGGEDRTEWGPKRKRIVEVFEERLLRARDFLKRSDPELAEVILQRRREIHLARRGQKGDDNQQPGFADGLRSLQNLLSGGN